MTIVRLLVQPIRLQEQDIRAWMSKVSELLSYQSGASAPAGLGAVPRWIGDIFFNTGGEEWYISTGLTSSDWIRITYIP